MHEREVTVIGGREVTVCVFNGCAIGGLQKCPKSIRSGDTFQQRLVTVDFDDISFEQYGQLII